MMFVNAVVAHAVTHDPCRNAPVAQIITLNDQ